MFASGPDDTGVMQIAMMLRQKSVRAGHSQRRYRENWPKDAQLLGPGKYQKVQPEHGMCGVAPLPLKKPNVAGRRD
jgi:hypothetical protein